MKHQGWEPHYYTLANYYKDQKNNLLGVVSIQYANSYVLSCTLIYKA